MTWASQRRFIIVSIIVLVFLFIIAVTLIATLHKTPSCTDRIQNQDEQGVDCGGSCAYLCVAQQEPPATLFTRTVSGVPGRVDVIASVLNKNLHAGAKNVRYTVRLYTADRSVVKTLVGTLDLPPAAGVEGGKLFVFIPGAFSGPQAVISADLQIDQSSLSWLSYPSDLRVIPSVSGYTLTDEAIAPRIGVTLTNPSTRPLMNVKVYAAVFDAGGNVMAASQTVVSIIPALGSAPPALFTWSAPFPASIARVEILPIIPLP